MAFLEPFAGPALKLLAPFAGSIAIAAAGFAGAEVYEHKVPWGLAHSRDAARAQAADAKTAVTTWRTAWTREKAAYDASERLRGQEQGRAADAVTAVQRVCQTRVDAARKSMSAIAAIISKEPAHDPASGCPVPALVDPGLLCDATGGCASGAGR